MSDERLLDEHVLRRALRLDVTEVPPRLDPVLIAAAARTSRAGGRETAGLVTGAFLGGWIWSEVVRAAFGGLFGGGAFDPLGAIIALGTSALIGAAPVIDAATHPAIPIAILTAALFAALSERRRTHVTQA